MFLPIFRKVEGCLCGTIRTAQHTADRIGLADVESDASPRAWLCAQAVNRARYFAHSASLEEAHQPKQTQVQAFNDGCVAATRAHSDRLDCS